MDGKFHSTLNQIKLADIDNPKINTLRIGYWVPVALGRE